MTTDVTEEDLQGLAAAAHGFVGADLAALAQEAALTALRRIIAKREAASPPGRSINSSAVCLCIAS